MTSTRSAAATGLPISRHHLESLIEEAIAALDLLDPDPDLEETGDLEPSLGAGAPGYDLELDQSDYEPSLGSLLTTDQRRWADGAADDCEFEHDGREFDGGA